MRNYKLLFILSLTILVVVISIFVYDKINTRQLMDVQEERLDKLTYKQDQQFLNYVINIYDYDSFIDTYTRYEENDASEDEVIKELHKWQNAMFWTGYVADPYHFEDGQYNGYIGKREYAVTTEKQRDLLIDIGLVNINFENLMESYVDGELSEKRRIDEVVEAFNEMDEELTELQNEIIIKRSRDTSSRMYDTFSNDQNRWVDTLDKHIRKIIEIMENNE